MLCCDANAVAQTGGANLNLSKAPGNQFEAAVALSPKNNKHIFVVTRNEQGGLWTARSAGGGTTWSSRLIARTNQPAAGAIPRADEVITLNGIGFGPATPLVPVGTITAARNQVQNPVSVLIDQIPADLSAPNTYAGLAPGAVGLHQLNLVVSNVLDGDHTLKVSVGNTTSPQNLFIDTKQ